MLWVLKRATRGPEQTEFVNEHAYDQLIILVLIRPPLSHILIAGSNQVTQLPEPLIYRGFVGFRATWI